MVAAGAEDMLTFQQSADVDRQFIQAIDKCAPASRRLQAHTKPHEPHTLGACRETSCLRAYEAKVMEFPRGGADRAMINGRGPELVMTELNPDHLSRA